jgi:hypothetical protein
MSGKSKKRSRKPKGLEGWSSEDPLAGLWSLRAVLSASHCPAELRRDDLPGAVVGLLDAYGVCRQADADCDHESCVTRRCLARLEGTGHAQAELSGQLERAAGVLGLQKVEVDILALAMRVEDCAALCASFSLLIGVGKDIAPAVCTVLQHPEAEIRRALRAEGPLLSTEIIELWPDAQDNDCDHPPIRSERVNAPMLVAPEIRQMLVSGEPRLATDGLVVPAGPTVLEESDMPTAIADLDVLEQVLRDPEPGMSIVVTGRGTTSRAAFPRLLASRLEVPAHELVARDESGRPYSWGRIKRAIRMAGQSLSTGLLLVDVPADRRHWSDDDDDLSGFLHHHRRRMPDSHEPPALDAIAVPVIWMCSRINPSLHERADYIVTVRPLEPSARRRVIADHLGDVTIDDELLDRLSLADTLVRTDIKRACRMVQLSGQDPTAVVERTIASTMLARGETLPPAPSPSNYDPDLVNSSMPVHTLVDGLAVNPRATLLLSGPPGTGKTELARHIPIIARRASDLKSKWVGESEQNIAQMFEQAASTHSVLILDEADSFLHDRRNASRSWEVSEVNEMLTHMESFPSLFICTTNLVGNLDHAAFRRFDLKVTLSYLTPAQSLSMLTTLCLDLNVPMPPAPPDLSSLTTLTPGDYRTVRRQIEILTLNPTLDDVLDMLGNECTHKATTATSAGFLN